MTYKGDNLYDLCSTTFADDDDCTAVEFYAYAEAQGERAVHKSVLSYKALNQIACTLSSFISSIIGDTRTPIGVLMQSCLVYPPCILGVLKAKCPFSPLDASTSSEYIDMLINCTEMQYVIGLSGSENNFTKVFKAYSYQKHPIKVCYSENEYFELNLYQITMLNISSNRTPLPQDTAYVMHTSGTTGNPKIIAVPHRCIIPNITHLSKIFNVDSTSKVAMVSPPTFDTSVVEMFIALSCCAVLVIPSFEVKMSPSDLAKVLMRKAKITILQATPALIKRFSTQDLKEKIFSSDSSLKVMAFGGEECPSCAQIRSWISTEQIVENSVQQSFYNLYGITEVSSWATCFEIPKDDILGSSEMSVSLGTPLFETVLQVRSCDSDSLLCEIKCSTAGMKLANINSCSSYLLIEENTKKFLATDKANNSTRSNILEFEGKLFIGGTSRMCSVFHHPQVSFCDSGDHVKVKVNLEKQQINLFFTGRNDSSIKRNGKRINLLQISKIIEELPEIQCCQIVTVRSSSLCKDVIIAFLVRSCQNDNENTATFIVSSESSKMWTFQCFRALSQSNESKYLPDFIIEINILPITKHGKVDEKLLCKLFLEYKERKPLSRVTKDILQGALQMVLPSCLNKHDNMKEVQEIQNYNFIQMGGNSLGAVMLVNWLDFLLEISITQLMPDVIQILFTNPLVKFLDLLYQKLQNQTSETISENARGNKRKLKLLPSKNSRGKVLGKNHPKKALSITRGGVLWISKSEKCEDELSMLKCKRMSYQWNLSEQWKYNTGKCIDASPLIVINESGQGRCYIGSHSHGFYSLSLHDGSESWSQDLPDRIESSACISPCGDFIIVGCYDGNVFCLMTETGLQHWKFPTGSQVKCSPCPGAKGTSHVYIGSHDGFLYALDVEQRDCRWKLNCRSGAIFSTPCLSQDVANEDDGILYAATLGGNVLSVSCKDGHMIWSLCLGKPIFSSPCVTNRGLCVACVDHCVYFINHINGTKVWCFETGGPIFSSPCFSADEKSLFVGCHDGHLYRIEVEGGSLLWKTLNVGSPIYSTPFLLNRKEDDKQDLLADIVAFASTSGQIYIVDQINGNVLVSLRLPGEIFSSPVAVEEDSKTEDETVARILIGCRDDNLYCLKFGLKKSF